MGNEKTPLERISTNYVICRKYPPDVASYTSQQLKANVSQENPVLRNGLRHFSNVLL